MVLRYTKLLQIPSHFMKKYNLIFLLSFPPKINWKPPDWRHSLFWFNSPIYCCVCLIPTYSHSFCWHFQCYHPKPLATSLLIEIEPKKNTKNKGGLQQSMFCAIEPCPKKHNNINKASIGNKNNSNNNNGIYGLGNICSNFLFGFTKGH